MSGLPLPPAAYWDSVPWWAYLIVLAIIGIVSSPLTLQLIRGRGAAYVSREQSFAARQAKMDEDNNAFIGRLQASEQTAWHTLERERATWVAERSRWDTERNALAKDRDEGWDLARGMDHVAHQFRHEHIRVLAAYRGLQTLFRRHLDGGLSTERAGVLLTEIADEPDPPPVPKLRDVARRKPA